MFRKLTILIIPEGTQGVRRLRLPPVVVVGLVLMLMASWALAGYWFWAYHQLRADLPTMEALTRQNRAQQEQIRAFAESLAVLKAQMKRLKDFNQRLRVLANLTPEKSSPGAFGVGGPTASEGPGVHIWGSPQQRQLHAMRRELEELLTESELAQSVQQELAKFLRERRSILASTPSIWPVRGWVTSGFGYRRSPFTGKRQFHTGIDIATRLGTPIVAPADGVVTYTGWEGGFGRMLVINHGHGIVTRYGHLHRILVKVGQRVKRGQVIATVGNSGRSTGPHLHYEVLLSGVPTNPRYYILD